MISIGSRHSRRALAIHPSAIAFARGTHTGGFGYPHALRGEHGAGACGEFGITVMDQELDSSTRSSRFMSGLRACRGDSLPAGGAVIPARCTRRVPCSMANSTYRRRSSTVPAGKKPAARMVFAWAPRERPPGLPHPFGRYGAAISERPAVARSDQRKLCAK